MASERPPGETGPARPSPQELGDRIRALREDADLSLEQVAAATRIRVGLLRSIEAGDFAPCGGAVYARGHLRSIAGVVHGDGAELVRTYDRMAGAPGPGIATIAEAPHEPAAHVPFAELADQPTPPPVAPAVAPRAAADGPRPLPTPVSVTGSLDHRSSLSEPGRGPRIVLPGLAERERRGSPLLLVGIGLAAVLVVVAAIALVLPGGHAKNGVTAGRAPTTPPASSRPSTPVTTPTSPTAPATLAYAGVNVTVRIATQASWVHVTGTGGTMVFQGVLAPGATKDFHDAQTLKFVFGYAPSVDLVYNGRDIGHPPAGKGYVANATFTAQSTSG